MLSANAYSDQNDLGLQHINIGCVVQSQMLRHSSHCLQQAVTGMPDMSACNACSWWPRIKPSDAAAGQESVSQDESPGQGAQQQQASMPPSIPPKQHPVEPANSTAVNVRQAEDAQVSASQTQSEGDLAIAQEQSPASYSAAPPSSLWGQAEALQEAQQAQQASYVQQAQQSQQVEPEQQPQSVHQAQQALPLEGPQHAQQVPGAEEAGLSSDHAGATVGTASQTAEGDQVSGHPAALGQEVQSGQDGMEWEGGLEVEREAVAAAQQLARENSLVLREVRQAMLQGEPDLCSLMACCTHPVPPLFLAPGFAKTCCRP